MRGFFRVVLGMLMGAGALGVLFGAWAWHRVERYLDEPIALAQPSAHFTVPAGASVASVARDLEAEGIIDRAIYFRWAARLNGAASRIQAGEYAITRGMTPADLLKRFVNGDVIYHTLTFVEGSTFDGMRSVLAAHPKLRSTIRGLDRKEVMARLGAPGLDPEGMFFPDTYHFSRGDPDLAVLKKAYERMREQLSVAWVQRALSLPYRTPYEAVVMASIIEKETGLASERAQIAGVFVRRLQRDMLLQADPTLIYGIGAAFDGNITREHLGMDSPYNTYLYKGLTPTPIAMPGADALHAALHPAPGEALYFVARGDGSHEFTETLEDHERAVAQYQLGGTATAQP
ncbi:MAG: endolytic transglycosylase MltG [Gammaproteobacteria bacterium]